MLVTLRRARDPVRPPARRTRVPAGIGAVSLGTVLALAGCGGTGQEPVALPSAEPSAPSAGAGPTSSPSTPEDAVRQAYTAFWPNTKAALAGEFEQIRPTLARYATGDYLDFQVKNTQKSKGLGRRPWGEGPVVHITRITVNGDKAIVEDCLDSRNAALADVDTGQVVPGTRGKARQGHKANMERGSDGKWRVTGLSLHEAACSR